MKTYIRHIGLVNYGGRTSLILTKQSVVFSSDYIYARLNLNQYIDEAGQRKSLLGCRVGCNESRDVDTRR